MDPDYLNLLNDNVRRKGFEFEPGLTDVEVAAIEETYRFRFPPDLRAFLQHALPVGDRWVDWRHASPEHIRERLDWPYEGMCFDIENDVFWMEEWGPKPESSEEACRVARECVAEAPVMIPIYSHRYMPAEPSLPGNPVFSIWQTDIIHYGYDLVDYFCREFRSASGDNELPDWVAKEPRPIRFWDDLLCDTHDGPPI